MKNTYAIADLSGLIAKSCETIGNVTLSMGSAEQNDNTALMEAYQDILLNELENVQHMIIAMTQFAQELVNAEDHIDGSVFMAGELEDELGEITPAIEPEDEEGE